MPCNNPKENTGSVGHEGQGTDNDQEQIAGQSRGGYGNTSGQQSPGKKESGDDDTERTPKVGISKVNESGKGSGDR